MKGTTIMAKKVAILCCMLTIAAAADLFAMAGKAPSISEKVAVDLSLEKKNNGAEFAIVVKNISRGKIDCVFPSSNTQDFIVKDGSGNIIWQWTKDRLFTEKPKKVQIDPDRSAKFSVVWDYNDSDGKKVKAGSYQVTGTLPVVPGAITTPSKKLVVADADLEGRGGFTVNGQLVVMGGDVYIQSDDGISYLIANQRSDFKKLAGKQITVFSSVIENLSDSRSRKITITNYKVNDTKPAQ